MESIYSDNDLQNERLYLHAGRNSLIMKKIQEEQERTNRQKRAFVGYLVPCIKEYNEIITLIAKLIKELKAENNPIILSILLRDLIRGGYFSNNNNFEESNYGLRDISGFEGMDIIGGRGCCRHVAAFYDDLFKELRITSRILPCYITKDHKESIKMANHAVTLITYDDVIYAYDLFKDIILKTIDSRKLMEISGQNTEYNYLAYYKPSVDMMIYNVSYDEMHKRLKELKKNSKKEPIDYDKCIEFHCLANDIFSNNEKLLNDFKTETRPLTKKLTTGIIYSYDDYVDDHYH